VEKRILKAIIGIQSLALFSKGLELVPNKVNKKIKVVKPKKIIKGFTNILVGNSLLKPTSKLVNNL